MPYPKTLAAVQNRERSGYDIATALWDEVAKTQTGSARQGEIKRVQEYLTKNEAGDTYNSAYLSRQHRLGGWISTSKKKLPMPPRMALEAMDQNLTPDEAESQWKLGPDDGGKWTLRKWAESLGHRWEDVQAETVAEAVEELIEEYGADVVAEAVAEATTEEDDADTQVAEPDKPDFDELVDRINLIVDDLLNLTSEVAFSIGSDASLHTWAAETARQLRAVADHLDPASVVEGQR